MLCELVLWVNLNKRHKSPIGFLAMKRPNVSGVLKIP